MGLEPEGDAISGRRLLMWNEDVEISLCRPDAEMDYFFRNGEGDEVIFVHEGSGTLETIFGDVPYKEGDYVVVPRGTTYRFRPEGEQRYLVFESPGLIEIPERYRNEYGQLLEHAPYYHRDIHPPTELHTHRDRGEFRVKVRIRDGYQTYELDYHPFDVVGWDGYVYPWTFSIHDFEPITGRIHMPPPSHQTFEGRNFVICSFCPRKLDFDPLAIPIPYHHSNLNSEEMIYYVSGNFGSRRGIEVGSVTLHPSGHPARAASGPRGEVDRPDRDARAGRDVRHLPPAAADQAREGARRRRVRLLVARGAGAGSRRRRRGSRRRHLALLTGTGFGLRAGEPRQPGQGGGVAERGAFDPRRGSDLGQDALVERGPDRGEQRLAPGGGDAASDSERPGVGDGDERGGREADRVERVCEHAAGPVVGLGLREQRGGLRPARPASS